MADKEKVEEGIRIIDEGKGAHLLAEISERVKKISVGGAVVIAYRLGFSDRLLYRYLLPLIGRDSAIVLVGATKSHLYPERVEELTSGTLPLRGKAYVLDNLSWHKQGQTVGAIVQRAEKEGIEWPIAWVVDTLQPWSPKMEEIVRFLLEKSTFANTRVWLHMPLALMPKDLFTVIGNILILWPSPDEISFLRNVLPQEEVIWDLNQPVPQPQGAYVYRYFSGRWEHYTIEFPQ